MFPPHLEPARARALREAFERLNYTVAGVCQRADCPDIYAFRTLHSGRSAGLALDDGLDVLIRLFMDGEPVASGRAGALLPAALLGELSALELVAPATASATDELAARALLYPTEGLYIASDLEYDPAFPTGRPDTVYPAITHSCQVYLSQLPRSLAGTFLEVCSGTGIAALLAARGGARAWAVDITARSTEFARFNAQLNELPGVTPLQGDLFQPVEGLQFDHIFAHPPYVPSLEQRQIYRDGGADGEHISRRLLGEVGRFLRPGGRLYCTCVATDRQGAPLERRAREMLGPGADEFDVLLLVNRGEEPAEYLANQISKRVLSLEEVAEFRSVFDELKVEQFVGCTLVIERHAAARPPLTLRRQRAPGVAPVDLDGLLRWQAYPDDAAGLRRLLGVRPRLALDARMVVSHEACEGAWLARAHRVTVDGPLPVTIETSPQAATFLAWCDGRRTLREHCDRLEEEGAVHPGAPRQALADMVRSLLAAGVLQADLPTD